IQHQRQQTLAEMMAAIPMACDHGTKCHTQGNKIPWQGYKLHLDTAECGVPIAAVLSSASMFGSRTAYDSYDLHEHSCNLRHVAWIDHKPRGGQNE
ncbi:MAG: IS5/IS1182 family transposase, partial [Legionellales bacterium]|nr:IS5/IS1182 family transposase [Legionellales bacterium]